MENGKIRKQGKDGECREKNVLLPVALIECNTVCDAKMHKKQD